MAGLNRKMFVKFKQTKKTMSNGMRTKQMFLPFIRKKETMERKREENLLRANESIRKTSLFRLLFERYQNVI